MSNCTCGQKFLDAEDFRDHLPCPGRDCCNDAAASAIRQERKAVREFLGLMQICPHQEPADYASMIEQGEHLKTKPDIIKKYFPNKDT